MAELFTRPMRRDSMKKPICEDLQP